MTANLINFQHIARRFVGGEIESSLGDFGTLVVAVVALVLELLLVGFLYRHKLFLRL